MSSIAEIIVKDGRLTIYIDSLPHLSFRTADLVFFQSWMEGRRVFKYVIEFTFVATVSYTEYENRDLWASILKLLNSRLDDIK